MAKRSHGLRSKTRRKLSSKKKVALTPYLQEFKEGDKVHIKINPSSRKIPHPRFHGMTGKVVGKRGKAFIIEVKKKTLIVKPEHLKVMK